MATTLRILHQESHGTFILTHSYVAGKILGEDAMNHSVYLSILTVRIHLRVFIFIGF